MLLMTSLWILKIWYRIRNVRPKKLLWVPNFIKIEAFFKKKCCHIWHHFVKISVATYGATSKLSKHPVAKFDTNRSNIQWFKIDLWGRGNRERGQEFEKPFSALSPLQMTSLTILRKKKMVPPMTAYWILN